MRIGSVEVAQLDGAFAWVGPLAIDVDGAPGAYRLGGGGLDAIGNAHRDPQDLSSPYVGVALDAHGVPYVQGAGDPCPGALVSTTALQDHSFPAWNPRRYVDATSVPYLSVSSRLLAAGVHLGDVAIVQDRTTGRSSAAIVADVGPAAKLGEGSPALARAIGVNPDARHGGADRGIVTVVFAGSTQGWPRTVDDFAQQAVDLLIAWGGFERLATL